ncbi:MAG: glutamine-hydrolyzing GMP synthase [Anaerolineales bacterium]|nr:glutamine-hydrolyzing GMP synthase [Anaerolineales bacterium]
MTDSKHDSIAILDYGSQYSQLIARRVRESQVYCELFPWDTPQEKVMSIVPQGIILSGGPSSVYEEGAPYLFDYILESGLPILGICYGMHLLTQALGGKVSPADEREYGFAELHTVTYSPFIPSGNYKVWMSHGDKTAQMPAGFTLLAESANTPIAAMGNPGRGIYAVQFHPEVHHTPRGKEILNHFVKGVCGVVPNWTPESIIKESVAHIREQVGDSRVLSGVSGGVDSSVATALVHQAVGDQLVGVFVDTGMLRKDEGRQVVEAFQKNMGVELIAVDAEKTFLQALEGVIDPEKKRHVIGEKFIRVFEEQARVAGQPPFLVQGTIYPDVVESSGPDRSKAQRIKSHHNVGGLPENMHFELVEPLRYLFKDEVRAVGEALGLPAELVWRQPFPGPGLGVRCLGEITKERLDCLRGADAILLEELGKQGLLRMSLDQEEAFGTAQAFAVLLPVRSVGVMGDQRTYQETCVLRAVTTEDFMTADWARLPYELLANVSSRIVNEVKGINRVVYDISSKPPATIEWE